MSKKLLLHAQKKHFFIGDECLKVLDPNGTLGKWISFFVDLAQTQHGLTKDVSNGQLMEIIGKLPKSGCSETLDVGVRLFKPNEATHWVLTTVLTIQPK